MLNPAQQDVSTDLKIVLVSLHVRHATQAIPLAAGNLKAALPEALQEQTILLNFFPEDDQQTMLTAIRAESADLVAFSLYLWNRERIVSLGQALRQADSAPYVLAGGPEASSDTVRLLETGAFDGILRGEGEASFRIIAGKLAAGESLDAVPGLCCPNGELVAPARNGSMESLPSPWLTGTLEPSLGGVLWESARGCAFACDFCYDARGQSGVRPFSTERLTAELEHFDECGVDQVWVLDSSCNVPVARGQQLLQLLLDHAPDLYYHLEAKAEFLDKKTIAMMEELACSVQVGVQSFDPAVLAGLKRKVDPRKFQTGLELLASSSLTFGLDLIYGLPGDSAAGFREGLNTILNYRPNQVDVFALAVLPGTPLYERKEQLEMIAEDQPPYLLQESRDFPRAEMENCDLLKAVLDIFYNHGRAVAFFLPFCKTLDCTPISFLEGFRDWLLTTHSREEILAGGQAWTATRILPLQQEFLRERFVAAGQRKLLKMVHDIVDYHFHYAESVLGPETLPAESDTPPARLKTSPGVRLLELRTDILGALEAEEIDLSRWRKLVESVASPALIYRRGGEVFSELLSDNFHRLLQKAEAGATIKELTAGIPRDEADELLAFAWDEGFLIAAD